MTEQKRSTEEMVRVAVAMRQACLDATVTAYETARLDGLCHEGAWECAVDALRAVDVAAVLTALDAESTAHSAVA